MEGDKPFRSDIRETFVSFIISFINLGKTKIGKLFSSFSSDMQIFVSLGIVMLVHLLGSIPPQKRYPVLLSGG